MVLHDVDEVYTVLLRVLRTKAPAAPDAGDPRDAAADRDSPRGRPNTGSCTLEGGEGGGNMDAGVNGEVRDGAPVAVAGGGGGGGGTERWVRKQETRRRKLRHVFVRGDNIVLVSLVDP